VLSDGDGNPRLHINSNGVISGDGSGLTGVGGSTTYGAVGTYGLFYWNYATQNSPGTTVSGGNLYPAIHGHPISLTMLVKLDSPLVLGD